ncbi:MAG: hypothetical protein HY435_00335 [Candidatus Liptonbacteria bacterium]|nr:hypothetical protein [Candidatus Liptonbacteria bacterium]
MEFIRDFRNINKNQAALAGGKGASLGEMTQASIPVPPGFVILSTAFERLIEKTDLDVEIDAILDSVNHKEIHTTEKAAEKIQALIMGAEMPADIANEVQAYFKELDAKWVAVRSSATAEDSSTAAWAGQLESYLNTTEGSLLENVKKCWASLFTPRAIFYRFEKELHKQKISVAVVVQKMVESEVSGIAFSVHPVTQDRNQLIIEAGFGLGEAIVSGQITPDSYVVEKKPRQIIDKNVFVQARGLYRAAGGGNEWRDIPKEIGERQVLTDEEIMELAEIVLKIEKHYGFPVDIEWAREKNTFFIVQSRPITTLGQTKATEGKRDLVKEYGLNRSTWTYKGLHGVLHTFFPLGRLTGFAMIGFFGDGARITLFFVKDNYIHWYWNDNELTRIREVFFDRLKKNKNYLKELEAEWMNKVGDFEKILKRVDAVDLSLLQDEELASLYDDFYKKYIDEYKYFMTLGDAISMHADRYLVPEFQKILGREFTAVFPKLIVPQYLSFIEEESREREKLAHIIREKGSVDWRALEEHANRFFYIHNNYAKGIYLAAADFEKMIQEDIEKNVESAKDTRKQQLIEKQQLIKKYNLSSWHLTLLYVMDEFFKLQDTRKKYVLISSYYQFKFLKEAERRSGVNFNLLQYSIYLEFRDVLKGTIDTEMLVERQKICMCVHVGDSFKIIYGADAERAFEFFQKDVGDQKELKGMIASTGKVRGRVKKILKIHDMANMEEGDILVSSMTRPEMVPAMKLAAAIVTDEGGVTSHAAIVSRELHIPCIIGTKNATSVLKDGDIVEVDADKGVIKILEQK